MTTQMDHFRRRLSSVGQRMFLNARTPPGLFEAINGNRYVIVNDSGRRFAIALAHSELLPFTWRRLSKRRNLEYGRHWGGWRLRLSEMAQGYDDVSIVRDGDVGDLMIDGAYCSLVCRSRSGEASWLPLGRVSRTNVGSGDYSGWAFETAGAPYTFYEKSPTSHVVLGYLQRRLGEGGQKANP